MIEVRRFRNWNEAVMRTWLEKHVMPHLTPDVSNYAQGRLRTWIGVEPPLFKDGIFHQSLVLPGFTDRIKALVSWNFDYCLVTYSGEGGSGILPHRDAGTLSYEAMGLELAGIAEFTYWSDRDSFGPVRPTGRQLTVSHPPTHSIVMEPGTLIHFNSKCLHSCQPSPGRWALNMWKKK